ncbi:MAG TPA: hypothetical protein PLF21_01440 [Exilispira sp.]|nr:hypothetical protein [Exilispira sp.]
MRKRLFYLFIISIFFIFIISISSYGQDRKQQNWAISYINNSPFIFSISGSLIFSFTGMVEMNLGKFYFGQIPLNYCFSFISALFIQGSTFSLAFSPILTVHLGLASVPIEFIEGIGLGVGFEASDQIKPKIGFTALFQLNYYLSKYNGIFLQISSISGYMNWGFGIFFNTVGGKK